MKQEEIRQIEFNRDGFDNSELLIIYKKLLLPRLIEEKMLILLRQGKLQNGFQGGGKKEFLLVVPTQWKKRSIFCPCTEI